MRFSPRAIEKAYDKDLTVPSRIPILSGSVQVSRKENQMSAKNHAGGFLRLVEDAKSRVREVALQEVVEMQRAAVPFIFVDVREDDEWRAGHAAGAIHLGKGVIERDIEKAIPDRETKLILYCGGGFRSALAADSIGKMGYKNVWSMDGGMRAWREAGLPEEKAN